MCGVVIPTYCLFAHNQHCDWSYITDYWFCIEEIKKVSFNGLTHSGRSMRWYLLAYLHCSIPCRCIGYRACSKLTTKFQFVEQLDKLEFAGELYAYKKSGRIATRYSLAIGF